MTHEEKAHLFYSQFEDKLEPIDYQQFAYEIIASIEKEHGVKFSSNDKEWINEAFVEYYGMKINLGE